MESGSGTPPAEGSGFGRWLPRPTGATPPHGWSLYTVFARLRPCLGPGGAGPGARVAGDARFVIRLAATGKGAPGPPHAARLTRLGREGWAEVAADRPDLKGGPVPAAVRLSLPALRDKWGVSAVPHLYYTRAGGRGPGVGFGRIAFCPPNSISGVGFRLA